MTLSLERTDQLTRFARYGRNFFLFCQEVMGFGDLLDPHRQLCEFLQHDPHTTKLILMPRYSFKSSLCTIAYSLWRLSRDDSLRILIYSHSNAKAEGFLGELKHHMLGESKTSRFRHLYGAWESDPKRGVWNQAAITVSVRQHAHAEPSVDTAGIETGKVGAHYDLIIFDDLVAKENVTTKEQMEKVAACYQSARSLLKPGGEVLVVGTRWHFWDLYGRLLAERDQGAPIGVLLRKAEEDGTYPFAGNGTLTPEFLAEQKRIQGSYVFSCLYQNSPVDDETQTFKPGDFRFYTPAPNAEARARWLSSLYVTAVLDAIPPPTSDHGDDAAITVVGTDAEQTLYVLDAVAGRFSPEQQIDWLIRLHQTWGFRVLGLETNAFQRMVKTALEARLASLRGSVKPFAIVEFSGLTQGNKEQRIQGLQPWHERGQVRLPGERLELLTGVWSQLAFQLLQFPHSQKDDLVDSLAYHLQIMQKGAETPQMSEYPWGSAAWYEREIWMKQQWARIHGSPRWNRPGIPHPAFS